MVKEKLTTKTVVRHTSESTLLPNVPIVRRDEEGNMVETNRLLKDSCSCDFNVIMKEKMFGTKMKTKAIEISKTELIVDFDSSMNALKAGDVVNLRFKIPEGTLGEGYESTVRIQGTVSWQEVKMPNGEVSWKMVFRFVESLDTYFQRTKWRFITTITLASLLLVSFFIVLMRVESLVYFKFNKFIYFYSLIAATFLLTRYIFGALYKNVPINPNYRPGVSIIIPVFNEEEWIHKTIYSCLNQNYPIDKLEVIVVDDQSTDLTVENVWKAVEKLGQEDEVYKIKERLQVYVMPKNGGKREALVDGVAMAKHDLVVFVDSDSFLEPNAILNLVQPFQDPKMGGVAGRTDVENKYANSITKLQVVRYYIAFRVMKAAESYFDCVTCLSGPLSCYRKSLILEHQEDWLNQTFLGQPATFGDDRSMTNFILQTHRTAYQDKAICSTVVPDKFGVFLKQQMRWKRSWLRESLRAGTFIWKKEVFMALFFYVGLIVPIAAPVVVLYNLVYVPLYHGIFPATFLMGLFLMAFMMSAAYLFFKRSSLWIFGFVFVLMYEAVLLWQMPVAWVTFWKSTWGTRDTPQDIEAREKKLGKKLKKDPLTIKS
ncbi:MULTISPECIES: glycosyltransferase [Sporosarcina]|uniref:glycosyltransferase family 2 protein n=1 Tax=Sporosarcina TaxID=1569 RepID=UPI000A17B056|nr:MULTISPECIES: glycosyltransferase [Sporosarcina]ARK21789.1 hyaluronan synthase [Sporosarcina ureae]PIC72652.1 hyaluronan synthase [Sporosarcina sp. P17b]